MEADEDKQWKDILFYFDTDERASPFDICQATDAGFDMVFPYEEVSADSVSELVQDAVFSRGSEGVKHTSFSLGERTTRKLELFQMQSKKRWLGPFRPRLS